MKLKRRLFWKCFDYTPKYFLDKLIVEINSLNAIPWVNSLASIPWRFQFHFNKNKSFSSSIQAVFCHGGRSVNDMVDALGIGSLM